MLPEKVTDVLMSANVDSSTPTVLLHPIAPMRVEKLGKSQLSCDIPDDTDDCLLGGWSVEDTHSDVSSCKAEDFL